MWMVGIEPSSSRRAASVLIPLSQFSSPSGRILGGDQSEHHLRESVEEKLVQAQKRVSQMPASQVCCAELLLTAHVLPVACLPARPPVCLLLSTHSPGIRTQIGEKVHPYLYFLCFSCRISFSGRPVSRLVFTGYSCGRIG